MAADRLQAQRYEHKYVIREEVALAMRDFVSSYLDIDEFGKTQPNLSYPVHSLYLDSNELKLYEATINGDKNRYKLRLRFYDDKPEAPIYFEIKRRCNNTIAKQRGGVYRDAVDLLAKGQLPDHSHLVNYEPKQLVALQNFVRLMSNIRARPKAHVAYIREAWVSKGDNSVRVTLDRRVACGVEFTTRLKKDLMNPAYAFGDNVILELKFTNRYPDWFRELVRVFGLMQRGAAKYVDGVNQLGAHRVRNSIFP
jgi:hypothetical protein